MKFIWATRGKTWGFRFLRKAGFADALPEYSAAFAGFEGAHEVCEFVGGELTLRFDDPQRRTDLSGRVIPHDFVVYGLDVRKVLTLDAARELIWPLVQDEYAGLYDAMALEK